MSLYILQVKYSDDLILSVRLMFGSRWLVRVTHMSYVGADIVLLGKIDSVRGYIFIGTYEC